MIYDQILTISIHPFKAVSCIEFNGWFRGIGEKSENKEK